MASRNPLHDYNSYAYQHVLMVCDNTQTAEDIANLEGDALSSQILSAPGIQSTSEDELYRNIRTTGSGNYVVLINAMTDADYFIKRASWQTFVVPRMDTGSSELTSLTSMAVEGQLTIVEPRGIRFLNIINNLGVLLETGPIGMVFVLKTIFVGHLDGKGGQTPEYMTDVKPLMFYMTDITAKFDEGGGEYEISLIGQSNGAAKSAHFSNLNVANVTYTNDQKQLRVVLETLLQDQLQLVYDQNINEAEVVVQRDMGIMLTGRRLKYNIVLDVDYTDDYIIDDVQIMNSDDQRGGNISLSKYSSVESMIQRIMGLCSKVNIDASGKDGKPKYIFKIHSMLTTTSTDATVTYYIVRYPVAESKVFGGVDLVDGIANGEVLEFDYLYSGRNIDIIEFDIKMEMGLAFFQLLAVTPQSLDDQLAHATVAKNKSVNTGNTSNAIYNNGILLPNCDYNKMFKRNNKNFVSAANFSAALSKHAALETLEAKIKIHGNPRLLNDFNILPSKMVETHNVSESTLVPNWHKFPSLIKINIFMPNDNSSIGATPQTPFQQEFWYNGLYSILTIDHVFEPSGLFTQELHVLSLPVKEDLGTDTPKIVDATTDITDGAKDK